MLFSFDPYGFLLFLWKIKTGMNKSAITAFIFVLFSSILCSQSTDISFEFQAYPTGLIPGLRLEKNFGVKHAAHIRVGYQWIRHRDLGEHEDERGNGYGFTLGYKRYFKEMHKGFSLSIRNDLWFNSLDWKDNINTPAEVSGTSDITVVQPTLELGYLMLSESGWFFTPSVAFGFEINVKTEGSDVGEGAILLLGLSAGKRF